MLFETTSWYPEEGDYAAVSANILQPRESELMRVAMRRYMCFMIPEFNDTFEEV